MLHQEHTISWTLRDGMPLSGDPVLDELHARVLTEEPIRADAIVWLQGNGYDRGPKVLKLFEDGFAPHIVVTGNCVRSPITVDHLIVWLTEHGIPAEVVHTDTESLHTRDQAVHVLTLAWEHDWHTLLLVASPHHQLRAFLTFCQRAEEVAWDGHFVNQPVVCDWDAVPSERTQPAREAFREEVDKLSRYRAHIATAHAAMAYIFSHADHHSHR